MTHTNVRLRLKSGFAKYVVTGLAVLAPLVGGGTGIALSTVTAHAANVQRVHAVHKVWLRSTHKNAKNGIRLEPNGENFTVLAGSTSGWWHVRDAQGRTGYVISNQRWIRVGSVAANTGYASALPPGVKMDSRVAPRAGRTASINRKELAVLAVAKSKLGTPYRWGHNEDRGQFGFDCSNFTAYVYHHALGYKMSGSSNTQSARVGWKIARSAMRPGDLLIFEFGKHVGIYVGNGKMINEGGGLGKVGYLSIGSGSYWGKHLTAVKRMF